MILRPIKYSNALTALKSLEFLEERGRLQSLVKNVVLNSKVKASIDKYKFHN